MKPYGVPRRLARGAAAVASLAGVLAIAPAPLRAADADGTRDRTPTPPLSTTAAASPGSALAADSLVGSWNGTLRVPGAEIPVVFHIARREDGGLAATLDSPSQGAFGIEAGAVRLAADTLILEVPAIGGRFRGVVRPGTTKIRGTWSQGGMNFPLELVRRPADHAGPARPQEPEPPYPYAEESVRFPNAAAGIELAGTLTYPRGTGPFPAVVLIGGSGPQDRDEAVFGHRPFLVLADHLTRHGIAVLRFDDRGIGESTGDFASATSVDFAGDVLAAVHFLRRRDEIDPGRIGLVGHSEGGLIAPMAAARSEDVAFIVILAGPGLTGEEILRLQGERIARANGATNEQVAAELELRDALFRVVREEPDPDRAADRMRGILTEAIAELDAATRAAIGIADEAAMRAFLTNQIRTVNSPWFRFFLGYDPRPALRAVDVPVLVLAGENDLQVPPDENLPEIEAALRDGGNDHFTIRELPGLNHLFQHSETGSPAEYARIEETFAPEALDVVSDWIRTTTGVGPAGRDARP